MTTCVHKGPECIKRGAVHVHGGRGYTGVSFCRPCAKAIFFPGEWTAIELALPGRGQAPTEQERGQ